MPQKKHIWESYESYVSKVCPRSPSMLKMTFPLTFVSLLSAMTAPYKWKSQATYRLKLILWQEHCEKLEEQKTHSSESKTQRVQWHTVPKQSKVRALCFPRDPCFHTETCRSNNRHGVFVAQKHVCQNNCCSNCIKKPFMWVMYKEDYTEVRRKDRHLSTLYNYDKSFFLWITVVFETDFPEHWQNQRKTCTYALPSRGN